MQVLKLDTSMGVKKIFELQKSLIEMLNSDEKELVIDFSGVDGVDFSVSQVLLAGFRYAKEKGTLIRMSHVSQNLRQQLFLTGFRKQTRSDE